MKTIPLRLILDVEFDPQGESVDTLKRNLSQVVRDAANNGTLTGETAATVEKYTFSVIPLDRQTGQHLFAHCGGIPKCVTCGCDEDDAFVGGEECTFIADIDKE